MKLARLILFAAVVACLGQAVQPLQEFLVVSDIHFNPLADPAMAPQLMAAEPSQWEALLSGDLHLPPQKFSDDSNWPLFAALLSGIEAIRPQPKLVILTGDILPHKFRDKFLAVTRDSDPAAFRSFTRKTAAFISIELAKAASGGPVVYTLGNNDEECGDYALQPGGSFLQDTTPIVQQLARLDTSAMATWRSLGSYVSANPLASHHRIVALNSNFWSRRYANTCGDQTTDPGTGELKWLGDQLKDARQHGDKVWLIYHIPPGIDGHSSAISSQVVPFWKPEYARAFEQLLDQYRNTIELNLAGHTHLDDIRLLKTVHTDTLVLINPALSPNVGQNPAFRVMTVDSKARLQDVMTYYLPDFATRKWQLEYSTRPAYALKKIDAKNYAMLYRQIEESPALAEKWRKYYFVSHFTALSDDQRYLRSLHCAESQEAAEAYQACLNAKAR